MSLETLLEAAKYLEWSSQSKARGDDTATDFHPYAKAAPPSDDKQRSPTYKGNSGGSGSNDDREKRRAGGAGTREVHNKLEKNRRAHLKECFEMLKKQLPNMDDKKTSNLSILRSALRYIQTLKRKEKEFEQEMQRLAQEKIATQERIIVLRRELVQMNVDFDMNHWTAGQDHDSDSTSTATADGDHPIMSEDEEEREVEASEAQVINIVPTTPVSKAKLPAPGQPLTVGWSQPAPNTITGRPTPTTVTIARTVATTTTYSMAASKSSGVTVTTAAGPQAVGRTPVTQILHQTITQRAALQQQLAQQKLQQQQQHQQKLQRIQPTPPAHVVTVQAAGGVRPVMQILGTARGSVLPPLRPGLALNHVMAPTGPIVTPAASILAAARQTVGGTAVNTVNQVAAIAAMNKLITGTVSASATPKVAVTTTLTSTTPTVSANQITSPVTLAAPISLSAMKHIIANQIPTAHLVSPVAAAHMPTIGQLMSQQSPRTSAHVNVSQMMSAAVTNIGGTQIMSPTVTQMSTVHPVMSSIAHVIPVTQIVSPMTLVSPAVQASSGLSQTQLNNVVNPPVIKPLGQIPIIQQSFSIQPQVVKPVVTVSVPNVVTTAATTPAVQVTVPVTHAS